jgi:hypothetical protein
MIAAAKQCSRLIFDPPVYVFLVTFAKVVSIAHLAHRGVKFNTRCPLLATIPTGSLDNWVTSFRTSSHLTMTEGVDIIRYIVYFANYLSRIVDY